MTKQKIAILTSTLVLFQLAAGCFGISNSDQKTVELVVWKPFEEQEQVNPLFDNYRKTHSNVSFRYVKKDITTYQDELVNALASGTGPDIFSIHNDWLPRYQERLAAAPDGLFKPREFQDTFVDVAKDDLYGDDGKLYAVPLSVDVLALYYNRDLLGSVGIAQPPKTWEEMISAVKKLTRQDRLGNFLINGLAMGTSNNVNRATDVLSLLMVQNGTQVYSSNKQQSMIDREVVSPDGTRYYPGAQALEFYTQFANPAKETYTWNAKNNYSIDAFVAGQTAMILSYSYLAPIIRAKAPLLNFGIAPVPQIDLTKPKVNFANYFGEGVSKQSQHQTEAWDFLKYATSAEALEKYYIAHSVPSSRRDLINTQINDPDVGVFAEGALTAKTFYKPDPAKVESIFVRAIDDVILRGKAPKEAIGTVNQLLGELIH